MSNVVLDFQTNVKTEEPQVQHPVGGGEGVTVHHVQPEEAALPAG